MEEEVIQLPDNIFDNLRDATENIDDYRDIYKHNKPRREKQLADRQKIKNQRPLPATLSSGEKARFIKSSSALFEGALTKAKELQKSWDFLDKMKESGQKVKTAVTEKVEEYKEKLKKPENIFKILIGAAITTLSLLFLFHSKFRHWVSRSFVDGISNTFVGLFNFITKDIPKMFKEIPKILGEMYSNIVTLEASDGVKKTIVKEVVSKVLDSIAVAISSLADVVLDKIGPALEVLEFFSTVASWVSLGATIGSIVPGLGNAAGAVIGAVIGVVVYMWDSYSREQEEIESNLRSYKNQEERRDVLKEEIQKYDIQIKNEKDARRRRALIIQRENFQNELVHIEKDIQAYSKYFTGTWYKENKGGGSTQIGSTQLINLLRSIGYKEGEDFQLNYYEENGQKKAHIKKLKGLSIKIASVEEMRKEAGNMIMKKIKPFTQNNAILKDKTDEEIVQILDKIRSKDKQGTILSGSEGQVMRDMLVGLSVTDLDKSIDFMKSLYEDEHKKNEELTKIKETSEADRLQAERDALTQEEKKAIETNSRYARLMKDADITKRFEFPVDIEESHSIHLIYLFTKFFDQTWVENTVNSILTPLMVLFSEITNKTPKRDVQQTILNNISRLSEEGMYNNLSIEKMEVSDKETFIAQRDIVTKSQQHTNNLINDSTDELKQIRTALKSKFSSKKTPKLEEKEYLSEDKAQVVKFKSFIDSRKKEVIVKNFVSTAISDSFSEQGSAESNNGGADDINPIPEQ